jgi:uroporphyrinogen decarboxylase
VGRILAYVSNSWTTSAPESTWYSREARTAVANRSSNVSKALGCSARNCRTGACREDVPPATAYDDSVNGPLVGFAGGPFTLSSYAVAGGTSSRHAPVRQFRAEHPDGFETLLERFATAVRASLEYQVASGADVVQLFDTYASVLPPAEYEALIVPLHREILADLDVPTIIFARNMGGHLDLLADTGADVVGLDWTVDMAEARAELGDRPVQGNLDPSLLFGSPDAVRQRTREVIEAAGPRGHILNLGHGVHRNTPVENVRAFVETAKAVDRAVEPES